MFLRTQGVLVLNSDGTYTFTPALNFNGVVTVSYQVCDATLCDTATLTITVNPTNDAPIAADDNISTNEETPASGTVATNDSDIDGDALTFTTITNVPASQGVFVLNPNGSYTFTPAANFNGTVIISYQTCDATLCDTATLTITVNAINDAPSAGNDFATTDEDKSVGGSVATNDSDPDGGTLTFTGVSNVPASQGVFVLNPDGSYTFTPAADFNGVLAITYQVCNATLCDTATLTITVNPINDAPIALDDNTSTNEDTAVNGTVATNDSDIDGDILTFTAITNVSASQGVFVLNLNGSYTFTPAANFNGTVVISYRACDATLCDTATLTITIKDVKDAPLAGNDFATTDEDKPVSGTVAANDTDPQGETLTFTGVSNVPVSQGVFVLNPDGTYTFTPAANFNGVIAITYQVCNATLCDTATLTITVNPINDAPIAVDDYYETNEDTPINGTVAANDTDTEGGGLIFKAITKVSPTAGTFVLNADGTFNFVPTENYNGTVIITYMVCDTSNACDTATLTIKVNPITDAPIAEDATNTTRNDTPVSGTLVPHVYIVDKTIEVVFSQVDTIPSSQGTIVIHPDGTYTFTPNADFVGVVTVIYSVCTQVNSCDTAKLIITVTPINNQAPDANDDSINTFKNNSISNNVILNDSDPEGQTLTVNPIPVTNPTNGTVTLNTDGVFTYTPNNGFVGIDTFAYQVCDNGIPSKCDTAIVIINVIDLPNTVSSTIENTLIEQVTDTICLDTRELVGKQFILTNICRSANQHAEYTIIQDKLCVKMTAILAGEERGCFVICDEYGVCDTTYIITTVIPRNVTSRIKAVNDEVTTKKGEPVISVVMSNDSLYNDGLKNISVVLQGKHGQAAVDSSNNIYYIPDADYCGMDSIIYQICTNSSCDMAVVKIKIVCTDIIIYNAFSPNNDGTNEFLTIEGLENYPDHKLEVFNRWGNKVFSTTNYQNDWAGTWGDKKLPDGTYYYFLDDGNGTRYTGYLQIHQ